jgi:hypothetical protein
MKQVCCLYCEGTDAKLAVVAKDKEEVRVLKVASLNLSRAFISPVQHNAYKDLLPTEPSEEISFDNLDNISSNVPSENVDTSDVGLLNSTLEGFKLPSLQYIPVVTDPTTNFHVYEGERDNNKKKLLQSVIADIQKAKGITVTADNLDVIELNEKQLLGVFLEGDIPSVNLINLLANYNKRRYLKIPTIKNAELSLAYYVSKTNKFFPEDYSLIIYIGKEYSRLLFLEGQKLKHIGTPLDIGTKNLHTYDVYFSKILLEMENGGIPKLDNIILCGEDRSENLILSFFGTFPEANVSELRFESMDLSGIKEEEAKNLALYAIPIASAIEYFDELDRIYVGINFLPRFIQENQKFLQFGWHSYAMLPFLFGMAFFVTFQILSSDKKIRDLDFEIERLTQRQAQNQAIVEEITPLDNRISNFDATQAILDSAAAGAGVWNKTLTNVSDFMERRRNFWITKLENPDPDQIAITGFSLTRSVLTEFADSNKTATLKNINYEPLREKSAFSYQMFFKLGSDSPKTQ